MDPLGLVVLAAGRRVIALVGRCGLERLADALRARGEAVAVIPVLNCPLLDTLQPELVYADPFDGMWATPLVAAAIARREPTDDPLALPAAMLASLASAPLLVRAPRPPPVAAFGLGGAAPAWLTDVFDAARALTARHRHVDIAGHWARHGILDDAVRFGPGHGEPELGPLGESRLGSGNAVDVEAEAVLAWLAGRRGRVFKGLVVDLDHTLVYGEIAAPDFAQRNPAWISDGAAPFGDSESAWWRAPRGLHEALRVCRGRGLALALCTRNNRSFVDRNFQLRAGTDPWTRVLHDVLLDVTAFDVVEAGFGAKSAACRRIADRLGVHPETLAFLDDSEVERAEVAENGGGVHVMSGPVSGFRERLLTGAGFVAWSPSSEAARRPDSWRSRAAVVDAAEAGEGALERFLDGLEIHVSLRRADAGGEPRVAELLARTHQLRLTGAQTVPAGARVYVATCRDRLADHGLVAAAWFVDGPGGPCLGELAVSCRVLPHRIASSLLAALLEREPGARVERLDSGRNGASAGLIAEAARGVAPWVRMA